MPVSYHLRTQNLQHRRLVRPVIHGVVGPQILVTPQRCLATMLQHLDLVEQFVVALVVAFWNFFLLLEVEGGRLHVLIGIFVDYFLVDGLHFVEFVLFVHGVLLEDLEPADGVLGVFVLETDGVLGLLLFHHDGALVVDEGLLFVVDVVLDVEGLEGGG